MNKRGARVILIDSGEQLVLLRRVKPGRGEYFTTVGGGVDPEDGCVLDALHREVREELGGKISGPQLVFLDTTPDDEGGTVQHFFLARLETMDLSLRTGEEFQQVAPGDYEVVRVPFTVEGIESVALKPDVLATYLVRNVDGLRALLDHPVH